VAPAVSGVGTRSTSGGGGRALVLPASAGVEVGGEPTAAADVGADAAVGEVGKWGHDGTPSGTSGEHYRTELPQPSSSLPHCRHGSHHL
jgi:hypothetical protein